MYFPPPRSHPATPPLRGFLLLISLIAPHPPQPPPPPPPPPPPLHHQIMLGVDRLDMVKGIPQKLLAYEKFLEEHPEWRDKVGSRGGRGREVMSTSPH